MAYFAWHHFFDSLSRETGLCPVSLLFILAVHPYVGAPHLYPVRYRFIRRGRPKCSATRSTDTYSPRVPAGSRASTTMPPALFTIS